MRETEYFFFQTLIKNVANIYLQQNVIKNVMKLYIFQPNYYVY